MTRPRWLLVLALLCTLILIWVGGHAGRMLTRWVVPPFLPLHISDMVVINQLSEGAPPACPDFGALLIISPERAEAILNQVLPTTRWLPPGLIRDQLILRGAIRRETLDMPLDNDIPLVVAIDRNIGRRPRLVCRVPADVINRIFRERLEDSLASKEEHLFGSYRILYRPTFKTFDLHSVEDYVPAPVMRRRFTFSSTGEIRIKLDDKTVRITTDGKVRTLKGQIDVRVIYDQEGYGFWYDFNVTKLRLDIDDVQESFDRAASEKLEKTLEKALDRRRSKVKLFKKRLPHWVPVDLALDFKLTPG